MSTTQFLFSGFGGQGILFAGKFLAYKGLMDEKQVSWLPSYGPEMRGGTASCGVINLPSLDKYESAVVPGGMIFADSTLIERKVTRDDVKVFYVPATKLANDNGTPTLANMVLMGKILKELNDFGEDSLRAALGKVISAKRADMLEVNLHAMQIGADYD